MANIAVRNLPDEIHNQLKERASKNRRSLEAEVRSILTGAVIAGSGGGLGQRLMKQFEGARGNELTIERDKTPSDSEIFG